MMMMMWDKGTRDVKNSTRVIQVLFKFLDDTRVLASNWYPNEYLASKNQSVHFSKGDSLRANMRPQLRISRLNWTDKWNTYVDVDVVRQNVIILEKSNSDLFFLRKRSYLWNR